MLLPYFSMCPETNGSLHSNRSGSWDKLIEEANKEVVLSNITVTLVLLHPLVPLSSCECTWNRDHIPCHIGIIEARKAVYARNWPIHAWCKAWCVILVCNRCNYVRETLNFIIIISAIFLNIVQFWILVIWTVVNYVLVLYQEFIILV